MNKTIEEKKQVNAKKMMLWFFFVSVIMMFAGLTSAYIMRATKTDWVKIALPQAFYYSTLVILLSSASFILAKKELIKANQKKSRLWMSVTILLGLLFVYLQLMGFQELHESHHYAFGPASQVASSMLFIISGAHLLHIFIAIIVLLVVYVQTIKNKYSPDNLLGFELGFQFWHFLDLLWVFLFLFLYFYS